MPLRYIYLLKDREEDIPKWSSIDNKEGNSIIIVDVLFELSSLLPNDFTASLERDAAKLRRWPSNAEIRNSWCWVQYDSISNKLKWDLLVQGSYISLVLQVGLVKNQC